MSKKSWTITVEEDPDTKELILPLSEELLKEFGWDIDTELTWEDLGNGSWSIKKVDKSE